MLRLFALFALLLPTFALAQEDGLESLPFGDTQAAYDISGEEAIPGEGISFPWQMDFMKPASPMMETLVTLHDELLVIITVITVFVLLLLMYVMFRFRESANPTPSKTSHNTTIEIIWTVVPIVILAYIAWPSWQAHKQMSDIPEADVTLKITGYQWYWNYEYPDEAILFDSNMKRDEELEEGEPRLLAVDNPIVVPVDKNVRLLLTGGDVLHAWALPAFGVKQDTVPGRLNETWFRATKEGVYYGQCSELCGRLHGFMPIEVHVVSDAEYAAWLKKAKVTFAANDYGSINVATNQ